jgi:hypothetical protein
MDTLTSKVTRLVRGQHGQRLAERAKQQSRDPQTRRQICRLRERLTAQLGPKREGGKR